MTLKFGTDGVRGVANVELTPELVQALGRAAARVLGGPSFVVGRDTRVSGPTLQAALASGLAAQGADVIDLGVVPTPAVAHASATLGLPAAMISASHNPYTDNGVKFFLPGGRKLSDEVEAALEAALETALETPPTQQPEGGRAAPPGPRPQGVDSRYEAHVQASLEGRTLEGLHVVVDCANGAGSVVAPRVLKALGAAVDVLHAEPDGVNINAGCGSTYPASLQQAVVDRKADVGLALDGDADRVLAVDHTGALVDGDQLMALLALDLRDRGGLHGDTLVVTVMSNLGLRLAMADAGVAVHETQVGDRYVLEALEANGWSLGGEQSGHVIFRDLATTGDGLLTGVQVLDVLRRRGRPLADLAAVMTRLPQVLRNVRVASRDGLDEARPVWDAVAAVEQRLGRQGRVLLRPSGTEPVVRVMVEAGDEATAAAAADELAAAVGEWGKLAATT
ncbi:MAG TPA: phosphoglucosamine mutase [Acidimicrobiales bacterium]|nr:phosphoglucosamine mutase [Acidimicrobiales bacterium]